MSNYSGNEFYSSLSKKEGYPARSVYKLKELQGKYNLIKKGDIVLDIGCSPGSWMMYCSELVGEKGLVVGVDISKIKISLPKNCLFYNFDIMKDDFPFGYKFNVVLSDISPKTSGIKERDSYIQQNMCLKVLDIADYFLIVGGNIVIKVFDGKETSNLLNIMKKMFKVIKLYKPKASRKRSKEIYALGFLKK